MVVLLTPFTVFLIAELIGASGVLAVVVCGLAVSQSAPHLQRPHSRQQTTAFWTLATFLPNGALFVLIGLELPSAVRGLTSVELTLGLVVAGVVAVVVIGVRFGWLFTSPYVIRVLGAHPP